jgi:hypothetical protein
MATEIPETLRTSDLSVKVLELETPNWSNNGYLVDSQRMGGGNRRFCFGIN